MPTPQVPYPYALEKRPTLRQSLLAQYDRCALSAHFSLEHERGWTSHPAARGQIFHRFAAAALGEMAAQGDTSIPVDVGIAILEECLRMAGQADEDLVNLPMREIKDLRWTVIKFCTDNSFDIENLVSIEERMQAPIQYPNPFGGSVERVLTGQLDALFAEGEDGAIVLDWKDTWALPAPTEVSFEGYFQQRFYAFLVFKNYPAFQRVTLREFYPRRSETREAVVYRDDLEHLEAELSALAERFDRSMEKGVWAPAPGKHCANCPLPTKCPIFPDVRVEGTIQTLGEAELVAQQLVVAKRAWEHRQKALRAWTDVHGPVPIKSEKGPRVWGYRETKRIARPSREEMEQALMNGGANAALGLYREQVTTRFEQFSPAPHEDVHAAAEAADEALMDALKKSVHGES